MLTNKTVHVHYTTSVKVEPTKNTIQATLWSQKLTERNISMELVTK